jgi:5-methylcytosine-specific restriction endonuclease McrA
VHDIDMDVLQAMRAEGKTYQEIAEAFGCSYGTIQRRLNPARAEGQRERYVRTEKARRQANPEIGREASRKWSAENPEKRRALARARYAANPEPWRERNRRNREKDLEANRSRSRERYAANSERIKEQARKYRAEHPAVYEESARKQAQRRREDVQYRFAATWRTARRKHERTGLAYEEVNLEALCERDGWTCQICGAPVDREIMAPGHPWGMSFDHVIPESQGGGWTWVNLQLAHRGCNIMRANRPLEEAREFAREFLRRLAA